MMNCSTIDEPVEKMFDVYAESKADTFKAGVAKPLQ